MQETTKKILENYCDKNDFIREVKDDVLQAFTIICSAYKNGNKLLVCGNGGSNSDADHIVGELLKGFIKRRKFDSDTKMKYTEYDGGSELAAALQGSLPAINLGAQTSIMTAIINDLGGELIFAQQLVGLGNEGDVLLGISTSGNSTNILNAGIVAKTQGVRTIGLTGENGGKMKNLFECMIRVPSKITPSIQDMHTTVYHLLCSMVENEFFGE